jgi:hypothetical protein
MSEMVIDSNGDKTWRNADGLLHRLDGPAIVGADGVRSWFVNGERHRLDGPAFEGADGCNIWCVNNHTYTNFKDFQEAGGLTDDQMCIIRLKYGDI